MTSAIAQPPYSHAIGTRENGLHPREVWTGNCVECGILTGAAARCASGEHVILCRKCQQRLNIWPEKKKRDK